MLNVFGDDNDYTIHASILQLEDQHLHYMKYSAFVIHSIIELDLIQMEALE